MIQINKRNTAKCILLSIITLGIYGIYWLYLLVKNIRSIQKNTASCTGEMLCLIFVPFYSLYWWYTRGEKVKQEFSQHNYSSTGNGIVYLILAIFGLSIVSMAIMQSDFNSLKSETHSEQRSTLKNMVEKLEAKALSKSDQIKKYGKWGLFLFVAIPLPGTGAWTGSLIASLFRMKVRESFPWIVLGVIVAGLIMSLLSFGIIGNILY